MHAAQPERRTAVGLSFQAIQILLLTPLLSFDGGFTTES